MQNANRVNLGLSRLPQISWKGCARAVLPKVGLIAMVCVYSIVGGLIFKHLEQDNEKGECRQVGMAYRSQY